MIACSGDNRELIWIPRRSVSSVRVREMYNTPLAQSIPYKHPTATISSCSSVVLAERRRKYARLKQVMVERKSYAPLAAAVERACRSKRALLESLAYFTVAALYAGYSKRILFTPRGVKNPHNE